MTDPKRPPANPEVAAALHAHVTWQLNEVIRMIDERVLRDLGKLRESAVSAKASGRDIHLSQSAINLVQDVARLAAMLTAAEEMYGAAVRTEFGALPL